MAQDTVANSLVIFPRNENTKPSLVTKRYLRDRRQAVLKLIRHAGRSTAKQSDAAWLARTYPVLSVLAPAQSSHEGKIEYPGDPMCLYGAISVAVSEVQKAKFHNLGFDDPYNDLCPQWGYLPSPEYRERCDSTIRDEGKPANTDQSVFDPRVWNEDVKSYFVGLLNRHPPAVVLISSVSCAHRYAIEIAKTVKAVLPLCLVVLGGRHADETMR